MAATRAAWNAALLLGGVALFITWRVDAAQSLTGQERAEAAGRGLVGSPAPKLVLRTIDGNTIDLGALYGKKAVYIKFWATWCVPCLQQMPHFEHTYNNAGPDLAVIAVNTGFNDSLDRILTYRERQHLTMPIVLDDGQAGAAFNLRVTPQHIVIGRDGRIQFMGNAADARLDTALETAQTTASTRPRTAQGAAPIDTPQFGLGDHLPDLTAAALDGHSFHLKDARLTQPTVLVFMSPWCESYLQTSRPEMATQCRQVREQVDGLAKQEPGIRWLAIASGLWATKDDLIDYKVKNKPATPLALDASGVLFRSFRIMHIPTVLIADGNGRIVRLTENFDANLPAELESLKHSKTARNAPPWAP